MIKDFIKKYQIHLYLLVLVLILSLLSIRTHLESTTIVEKADLFISLNALLIFPQLKLNTSLYLFYLYAFTVSILFYLIPKKYQWLWLLFVSVVFLALWDIFFLFVLMAITSLVYFIGIHIGNTLHEEESRVNAYLRIGLVICVIVLFGFKYGSQTNNLLSFKIMMPLGISYYIFQAISYLIDINSGKIKAERHFGYFAVYMGFFPKLFAGPIERAGPFIKQLRDGIIFDYQTFLDGIIRTFWGLFKKVMVVNRLFVIVEKVFSNPDKFSGAELWAGVFLCGFYIYFDFSALMDIVIGASQLFGIRLTENFKRPYLATSITDFWRRWHLSLSSWMRDYIFTP